MKKESRSQVTHSNGTAEAETKVLAAQTLDSDVAAERLLTMANAIHSTIRGRERTNLEDARQAGEILELAKVKRKAEGHRDWMEWIKKGFDGGYDTANVYINVCKYWQWVHSCDTIQEARDQIQHRKAHLEEGSRSSTEVPSELDNYEHLPQVTDDEVHRQWTNQDKISKPSPSKECLKNLKTMFVRRIKDFDWEVTIYLGRQTQADSDLVKALDRLYEEIKYKAKVEIRALTKKQEHLNVLQRQELSEDERSKLAVAIEQEYEDTIERCMAHPSSPEWVEWDAQDQ